MPPSSCRSRARHLSVRSEQAASSRFRPPPQTADGASEDWLPYNPRNARKVGTGSLGLELMAGKDDERVGLLLHFYEAEPRDGAMAQIEAMCPQ